MKSLVIIGASGVGKGTIINSLLNRSTKFQLVVSYTTRTPRLGQVNGKHYYFVDEATFDQQKNNMLEHKTVFRNRYGTSERNLRQIWSKNKIAIMDVDVEGMLQIRDKIECKVLCIVPGGWSLLQERLRGRKSEKQEIIQMRMEENRKQVTKMLSLSGLPELYFITNYQYQSTVFGIDQWVRNLTSINIK